MAKNTTPHPAEAYDRKVRETLPYYDLLLKETIDVVRTIVPNPACWVDTGCGTGNLIDLALDAFPDTRFLLADPSREMLDIAMEKNRHSPNVASLDTCTTQELRESDMATPDVVTAIQCHHYLDQPNRRKALDVCYNLLPVKGVFVTSENVSPATDEGIEYATERSIRFQMSQGRTEEESVGHSSRIGVAYFPITIESHLDLLRECGFRAVELFWASNTLAGFYCIK